MVIIHNKKAYVKTIEMFIAIVMTFIFLVILIPRASQQDKQDVGTGILARLEQRDAFRSCVLLRDNSCLYDLVNNSLPRRYQFDITVSEDPSYKPVLNATENIYTDSVFIAGNDTMYNGTTVRLFYWVR
jgi:competence protein ComGC